MYPCKLFAFIALVVRNHLKTKLPIESLQLLYLLSQVYIVLFGRRGYVCGLNTTRQKFALYLSLLYCIQQFAVIHGE